MDPGRASRVLIDQPSDFLSRFLPRGGPNETYESELPAFSELLEVDSPSKDDWDDEPEVPEAYAPNPVEEQPISMPNKTFEELLEEKLAQEDEPQNTAEPVKRKNFLKRKNGGLSSAIKRPQTAKREDKKQNERKAPLTSKTNEKKPENVEKAAVGRSDSRSVQKTEKVIEKSERRPSTTETSAKSPTQVRVKTSYANLKKPKTPENRAASPTKQPSNPKPKTPEKSSQIKRAQWSPEKFPEIEYDKNALEDVDTEINSHLQERMNELEENLADFRARNKMLTQKIKEYSQTYDELEENIIIIQQQKKAVKAHYEAALESELKKRKAEFVEQMKAKEQNLADRKDPEALNELRTTLNRLKEEASLVSAKIQLEVKGHQMELQEETAELEELEEALREFAKEKAKQTSRAAR